MQTPAPARPRSLLLAGVAVAAVGLSSIAVNWIAGGDAQRLVLAVLGSLVVIIAVITTYHWRTGISLFLVWLVFEDLPRKYLGNNMAIYFAKDLLVGVAYAVFLLQVLRKRELTFRPPFLLPLFLFFALGLLQVFSPNSPSIFYGLMGFKIYYYYIPLMFLGYALFRSERDLRRFLVLNLAVAIAVGALGIMQAIVGLDFLNPAEVAPELNLAKLVRRAPISGVEVARPSSVFVSEGRFGNYMFLALVLSLGASGYFHLKRSRWRGLAFAGVGVAMTEMVLHGSRGEVLFSLASLFVFFLATPIYGLRGRVRRSFPGAWAGGAMAAGVTLCGALVLFPDAIGARWAFYYETLAPSSPHFELWNRVWDYPLGEVQKVFSYPEWPLGYGIGTTGLGKQYVRNILGAPDLAVGVESGYGTLLLELGVGGLLLWLAWTGALLYFAWRVLPRLRGTACFPLGFAVLWFLFLVLGPITWGSLTTYQNFLVNAYLWLLVGILFGLPRLAPAQSSR